MRISVSLVACSAAMVVIFAGGAAAQGKGGPKPKTTSTPTAAAGHAPAAPKSGPTAAPKSHPTGQTKTGDTASAHGKPTTTTENHKPTTTTPATSPAAPAGATLTPVQQKLQQNTNLASKLQSRLPAGTDLNAAAAGFRNLGQFVAAVNVSNNLGLDFPTLKTAMVTNGSSLGEAIQAQKKTVDGKTVAARAEHDADTEIRSTEKPSKSSKPKSSGGRP